MLLSRYLLLLRKHYDVQKGDLRANNVTVGVFHGVAWEYNGTAHMTILKSCQAEGEPW
jgi:hypothetical protein